MTTHTSATALEETPHETETTTITISDTLKHRAQAVISDKNTDPQWRPIIRYALETNDPWLPVIVRRVEAGEKFIDSIDFSVRVSRSTNAASLPAALAPVTSCAFAARIGATSRRIAAAMAARARFLAEVSARAIARDASRARRPISCIVLRTSTIRENPRKNTGMILRRPAATGACAKRARRHRAAGPASCAVRTRPRSAAA